jgi:preprotein translocase subunit SecD
MSDRVKFYLILVLAVVAGILAYPREDRIFSLVGLKHAQLQLRQGLDLQGGAHLVYQADMSKVKSADRPKALSGLVNVIQRRVNPGGTSEIVVETAASDRVIVELPGVKDINEAINAIGKTAQLQFFEMPSSSASTAAGLVPTGLSGNDFQRADADIDATSGQPVIRFQFKSDAAKRFADLTTRINQEGGRLVIMLDNDVLFNGTVSEPITDGSGQMQGFSDIDAAKKSAVLLNAGALPVPVQLVEQRTVGATLGQESVADSLLAGIIGLSVVALFMLLYYRLAGLMAVGALAIYTAITITLYKLSAFTPYTIVLTLAGIAGFILSIGMAVDANILIFERMREELRHGKSFVAALEAGFDRAWPSIRDSNISTLITCTILYVFSSNAPIIKGFAVTLGLGVLISMFTAVIVSRTFLRLLVRTKVGRQAKWYGIRADEVVA